MIDHHSLFLLVAALASVIGLSPSHRRRQAQSLHLIAARLARLAIVARMPLNTVVHSFEAGLGKLWATSPMSSPSAPCSARCC